MIHINSAERVHEYVRRRVRDLGRSYRANESGGVAALAKLRRGVGTHPGADVELLSIVWEEVVDETTSAQIGLHDPRFPPRDDEPTDEEEAAFAAITLFALHQQSRREVAMHRDGFGFGRSARLLAKHSGAREAVRARFAALGTAVSWDETLHHARGLIQQLRQYGIALDYGQFARDLHDLRSRRGDRVRLAWGRDFYRTHHPEDDADSTEPATPTSEN